jgi:hypothetical protein
MMIQVLAGLLIKPESENLDEKGFILGVLAKYRVICRKDRKIFK